MILTHTLASIENSEIDSRGPPLGTVDVLADSTSTIKAVVAGVAVSVAIGNTGVGVAIGIAVARNFIGYDPDSTGVSVQPPLDRLRRHPHPGPPGQDRPESGDRRRTGTQLAPQTPMDGDIFEYLGPQPLRGTTTPPASSTPRSRQGGVSRSVRPSTSTSGRT